MNRYPKSHWRLFVIAILLLLTSTSLFASIQSEAQSAAGEPSMKKGVIRRVLQRIRGADTIAPTSHLEWPPARSVLPAGVPATIKGTATDSGGGKIARVEVSTDGGRTWVQAQGTDQWKFVWTPSATVLTTLLSRAIDDSGNMEKPAAGVSVTTVAAPAGSRQISAKSAPAPTPPPPGGGCSNYGCGDKKLADFQAGSTDQGLAVAHRGPGELILKPAKVFEFAALPADWQKVEPPLSAGSVTFNDGAAIVENAYAYSVAFYSQPRSIEFKGTFTGSNQRVGAGTAFLDVPSWARFATNATGTQLLAESANGITPTSTPLTVANAIGQQHVFRIEWTSTGVNYFVDDNAVASHSTLITSDMRNVIRDDVADGKSLSVRWINLSPYAATATFQSRIFDRGKVVLWKKGRWSKVGTSGSPITLCARTGNTAVPDATWTALTCQSDPLTPLTLNQRARYAQYQTTLTGNQFSTVQVAAVTLDLGLCDPSLTDCADHLSDGTTPIACTVDTCTEVACDPATDFLCDPNAFAKAVCSSTPNNALCTGGSFCFPQVCDPTLDCTAAPPPCAFTRGECVQISCNNTTAHCDEHPLDTACREQPTDNPCTVDTCNAGSATCVHTPGNTGVVCRTATATCSADAKCTGSSAICPPNQQAANGTQCSDNDACTKNDACSNGLCKGSDNCPKTKITGGGCVPTSHNTKGTFGFEVARKVSGKIKGHFTYTDKQYGIKIEGDVGSLVRTGSKSATFSGKCGTGCTFTVDVVDNGEPGRNDMIRVRITTPSKSEDTGLQLLCGGNIMFHPGGRHNDHDDDHDGHDDDDD
jgi:hypothetical protein